MAAGKAVDDKPARAQAEMWSLESGQLLFRSPHYNLGAILPSRVWDSPHGKATYMCDVLIEFVQKEGNFF